jgi:hypothetical protein
MSRFITQKSAHFASQCVLNAGSVVRRANDDSISQSPDGTVGANSPAKSSDKFAVHDHQLFNALRERDKVMFVSQEINGV